MRIARTISEARTASESLRPFGFVPTMGAFHEGHLSLMRRAKSESGNCIVSLFVNPTQFGPNEDFDRYPRNEELDFALAREIGVDCIFVPESEEMYPQLNTVVHVDQVGDLWEGSERPGHFDGVATVVTKLFNIVGPCAAYFGLKDLQQCAVIHRMTEDLNLPIELKFSPTVREGDGLAMSSRNVRLTEMERSIAPNLFAQISRCAAEAFADAAQMKPAIVGAFSALTSMGFKVDYLACVNPATMEEVDAITASTRIIAAARLGNVRLIDNVCVVPGSDFRF